MLQPKKKRNKSIELKCCKFKVHKWIIKYFCCIKQQLIIKSMKKLFFTSILICLNSLLTNAQYNNSYNSVNSSSRYQNGYTRSDGTYVNGHYKTTSNNTNQDNYSTKGNTNPYTGNSDSRARDYSSQSSNYGSGNTIQTGTRGGQYYINSNGNKVYVPKR